MADQNDNPIDVPEATASSSATPSSPVLSSSPPDQAEHSLSSTNSVAHDPNNPRVTVGFYGAYTGEDINGYYSRYRTATTESGITDVQLSTFLAASQHYLTPNVTVADVDTESDDYNEALGRSEITQNQVSSLLARSGLNLAPATYVHYSREAVQSVTEVGAPVPMTAPVPTTPSENFDISMTETGDAGTPATKKRGRKKVRFGGQ